MDLYTQHPPISDTEPTIAWKRMGGGQHLTAEQSKHTSLPNLVSFGLDSSPLLEDYMFQRTRHWLRGRSSGLLTPQLHQRKHSSRWSPRLVAIATSPQEQSAEQWFKFSLVFPYSCYCERDSLYSKVSQVFSQRALKPKVTWNGIVQQSFTHLLQLEWNVGRQLAHLA